MENYWSAEAVAQRYADARAKAVDAIAQDMATALDGIATWSDDDIRRQAESVVHMAETWRDRLWFIFQGPTG